MITILADTSALISLEIKGLVGLASKFVRFVVPTAVYEELGGRSATDLLTTVLAIMWGF